MSSRFSYTLGGVAYTSKSAVRLRCSKILKSRIVSAADEAFLRDFIDMHPNRDAKVGCGVKRFFVAPNGWGKNSVGFWIERQDGSKTDFGIEMCLNGDVPERDAKAAFRNAIREQITAFKQKVFLDDKKPCCALTGARVSWETSHVDHAYPRTFDCILGAFCEARGIKLSEVKVNPSEDGVTTTWLVDKNLEKDFQDFHQRNAVLRIVSAACNMRRGNRP